MSNKNDVEQASDVEEASERLANLSVCERSPLREIRLRDVQTPYSPQSSCSDQPSLHKQTSGSESEQDGGRDDQLRFNKLVKKAKHLAQEGRVREALELNRQALKIHHHEKLARRIAKMEEYLKNYGDDDDDEEDENDNDGMVEMGSGFFLYKDLYAKLYLHQKQGVMWMWGLHKKNKGGILGDDMGLGKTIQVIAFLSGLFDMEKVKHALIVVPVSVMINWEKEFNKWAPGITVSAYHGNSKRERERSLDRVRRRGGVLMTTYGMVVTSWEQLSNDNGREFVWDYVILDEGHKIKNPTKTTKGIHAVGAKHRLILSGTPIQNNLKELWTLFDYVHQGSLLGTLRTFKMEFENPIIRSRERDSTSGEKRLGLEMSESLKKIIAPFLLRRTKDEVKHKENQPDDKGPHKSIKMPTLMYKNDFVVWLFLSDAQLNIYRDFLQLGSVKELLATSKSPLVALTVLKKICDHPRLLSVRACHQLGLHGEEMDEDELELPSAYQSAVTQVEQLADEVLVGEAGKMGFLVALLEQLRAEGHRCLIFSQSRRMLDIIQKVLRNAGHKVLRLDGTVTSLTGRDERVQKFQKDRSFNVFLLTTQVGGVGLTLTAADRVVIYDPSWNPATDAQAVDRVFRIGQTQNVVVYRLITCGTVEEKIYRRQIFKDSITRQTTGGTKDPYRYFTRQELRELFQLDEDRHSSTQQQLEEMHGLDRRRDPELDTHIAFLHSLDIAGISDHDLMFSQESQPEEEHEDPGMPHVDRHSEDYIKQRVQKAKEIIELESSVPGTMEQRFRSNYQNPPTSVYAAPENQALMRGVGGQSAGGQAWSGMSQPGGQPRQVVVAGSGPDVPVFKPSREDSSRIMYNRIPGQPNVFRVDIQKPVKPEVKPALKVTARTSNSSDVVDLTEDDDDMVETKPAAGPVRSNQGVRATKPDRPPQREEIGAEVTVIEDEESMPIIQKKVKPQASPTAEDDAAAGMLNLSIMDDPANDELLKKFDKIDVGKEKSDVKQVKGLGDVKQGKSRAGLERTELTKTENAGAGDVKQEKSSSAGLQPPSTPQRKEQRRVSPAAKVGDDAVFKSPPPRSVSDDQKRKPHSTGPKTPKTPKTPSQQRVIEEELIISPNAYTPIMYTRQKRRRIISSPGSVLAFSMKDTPGRADGDGGDVNSTKLVEDSPDMFVKSTSGSSGHHSQSGNQSDELQSFLNEEDQDLIQESLVSDDEEGDVDSPPLAGNLSDAAEDINPHVRADNGDVNSSGDRVQDRANDDDDDVYGEMVIKKKRRSVCRRVAVVESSDEEDEEKENIHPSFSSKDDNASNEDVDANQSNNADDDTGGDEEVGEEKEEEGQEEEDDEQDAGDEGCDDDEADGDASDDEDEDNENQSVVVYDESMVEVEADQDDDEYETEEEEAGEEEGEEEEEEAPVDMEKIQELLKDAKKCYRQKRFREAKDYVDAALELLPDPELFNMAQKIQSKIDAGL